VLFRFRVAILLSHTKIHNVNHEYGLGCELPVTVVEQVLQTRTEQVDDQHAVQALPVKVIDIRNSGCFMSVESLRRFESRLIASSRICFGSGDAIEQLTAASKATHSEHAQGIL
jgi:hypothetical protein